ncbi:MAG: Gfo/Idh/MocA family protein [Flavisolibacter sp.]
MKVLIVGLGSIARKHIAALRQICPEVELFALRSSTQYSSDINGVVNLYKLEEAEKRGLDFVIVSNPTFKHRETIAQLIPLKLPLFIEKPLYDNLYEENFLASISELGILTYVGCNLRFLKSLEFAKEFLPGKRINEVNIYCGSYLPDWRPGQDFRKTYSANSEMGGGVHIDLIHEIDYAYWLFGKPNKVKKVITSKSSLNIPAADYANYILQYGQFNITIILNYFRRDPKRTLEVVCEDGTLNIDLLKNIVTWKEVLVFESDQKLIDTYKKQMEFFVKQVLSRKKLFNSIAEAYEILSICLEKE